MMTELIDLHTHGQCWKCTHTPLWVLLIYLLKVIPSVQTCLSKFIRMWIPGSFAIISLSLL